MGGQLGLTPGCANAHGLAGLLSTYVDDYGLLKGLSV